MAKEHTFRFAVRNKSGQHSQQWRIWTRHNDCYIGSRGTSQLYKASFHESGQCQVGLSSEIRKSLVEYPGWRGESRFYDQWEVPVDLSVGSSVKLLELVTPYSQLDEFEIKAQKRVSWIFCSENKAASVGIFKANIGRDQGIHTTNERAEELCRLPLSNGYSILVLARLIDEKKEYNELINDALNDIFPIKRGGKTYIDGAVDKRCSGIRAMIWHKNRDGRYWFEASLRKNFEICKT